MRRVFVLFVTLLFPFYLFAASFACQMPAHILNGGHETSPILASIDIDKSIAPDIAAHCDDDSETPPADIEDSLCPAFPDRPVAFQNGSQPPYLAPVVDLLFLQIVKPPPRA